MSPHDHDRAPDEGPFLSELSADTPLTGETALFVLSLHRDGRPVPAELLEAARAFAAADPATATADADLAAVSAVLADEPPLTTTDAFTDRVVAAASPAGSPRPQVIRLELVRRLAVAAALALALTLGWQAATPADLMADDATEQQRYLGDAFRADPYAAPDLDAGLAELVPGPLDGRAAPTASGDPADPADDEVPATTDDAAAAAAADDHADDQGDDR